eukprot:TRINITY_DN55069_c0_g1_i1.p1 TRINITY_DN55069_c0_g1~~TRINITY_DN55069_c0_g1_i1.p1  ORF type:complete len:409 (-),score=84.19 TRINITY_DN55069_c0_g1_i1:143-1264(-)
MFAFGRGGLRRALPPPCRGHAGVADKAITPAVPSFATASFRSATSAATSAEKQRSLFHGIFPILATPFRPDEALDVESFRRAVAFMAAAGVDGVVVTGVLGESNRLNDHERDSLVEAAVEVASTAGRPFPVCVGTSHTGTAATAALSRRAQQLGADAIMVTPEKEPSPASDDTIVAHFSRIAEGCPGLPIILQDHPASTQVHMSVPLLARIVREVPSVQGVKLESLPSPVRISALRRIWSETPPMQDCTILTGLGALYAGFDMEQGTEGLMTGFAFPEILRAMNNAAQRQDFERLHAIYARFLPLIVFEQQPGVAVRKEIYRLRGLFDCGHVRHPGANLHVVAKEALQAQLRRTLPGVDITKPLPDQLFDESN